ncbi:MAG: hypothetical protein COV48_12750, partial [Elusimicrobia bacterium CG11_big_fil_rev_8_21_14_0_20_64_6]
MPIRRQTAAVLLASLLSLPVLIPAATAQDSRPATITLFLDCQQTRCDSEFIRRELPYVNHVLDRVGSDLHLLVTSQSSGSGGRTYNLEFIGQGNFSDLRYTLTESANVNDSENEERAALTRAIERGVIPFVVRTRVGDRVSITVDDIVGETLADAVTPADDPWNFWVFNVGASGNYEAEESSNSLRVSTNLSANRVTEAWKIRTNGRFTYRESNFDVSGGTVSNIRWDGSLFGLVAKSIGDHWAAGGTVFSETSTSRNIEYSISASPTIEYNIFPYSESSQREFRFQYELNFRHFNYDNVTVFNRLSETVMQQQFSAELDLSRPWGNANARLQLESFLTDFEKSLTDLNR